MLRLFLLVILVSLSDVCIGQRYCALPRVLAPAPSATYTVSPVKTSVLVPQPIVERVDLVEVARALKQAQNDPIRDFECGCFTSEIISKLIDALVVSTTERNSGNYGKGGNLLNVALGDTDLLGVSISNVECFGLHRPMPHNYQPEPCSSSCDEIKTLLNLARILEEDDKPKSNAFNPEELIMKLVNALVVTSTSQNRCNCDYRSEYPSGGRGSQASRGHRDGLVNLDLLNPNNPNNVAQLDLGKQTIAGVGIGDTTNGVVGGALKDLL
ncbi:unnamed protein product [Leptosia nina]|uniref:Uncharacterized protein n=1 Tax=Leptosia nina TaxID=320188 RepID=A0AAV1JJP2_9NEOP